MPTQTDYNSVDPNTVTDVGNLVNTSDPAYQATAATTNLGGGVASGFDLGGLLGGAAQLGSTWYQNKENLDRLRQLGVTGQAEATRVGQQAVDTSSFKPYSVTTGAGTTQTDASRRF